MTAFHVGDYVMFQSHSSLRVWYGQIVGFCFKRQVAICTDGTGLPTRPVSIGRLATDPAGRSRCNLDATVSSE